MNAREWLEQHRASKPTSLSGGTWKVVHVTAGYYPQPERAFTVLVCGKP